MNRDIISTLGQASIHDTDGLKISVTAVRDAIRDGKHVPDWMMWASLQDLLFDEN